MLTKDLLKVKVRKGQLQAEFLDPNDLQAQELAETLLTVLKQSKGKTQSDLEEALQNAIELYNAPYGAGFVKLILDQTEYSETVEDCENLRWELITRAQSLRTEEYFKDKNEFQETLGSQYLKNFSSLSESLYADLPEFKQMTKTVEWDAIDMIHRYNCALVQSLLLLTPKLDVHVKFTSVNERRNLFRAIKFHRLVVGNIKSKDSELSFSIDGPLSLLVNTQAYGMRLANFFPRLILLKEWRLEACVRYKKKDYEFHLSNSDTLKSHYREAGDYRPEEFDEFLKSFNDNSETWQADWCEELISLGGQSFCFPDISFVNAKKGKKIHLELFHRWHRGELEKRMVYLKKSTDSKIIIGVCHSLIKHVSIEASSIHERDFDKFGFTFRGLPTPKAVMSVLKQTYGI